MAALGVAKNCTKLGLAGGAVYWSTQQGVWGTSEEGSKAMKRFTEAIMPEDGQLNKSVSGVSENIFLSYWNRGTKNVFELVLNAPESMSNYASKAQSAVAKFVEDNIWSK